jgi:hypothetical protein
MNKVIRLLVREGTIVAFPTTSLALQVEVHMTSLALQEAFHTTSMTD